MKVNKKILVFSIVVLSALLATGGGYFVNLLHMKKDRISKLNFIRK